MDEEDPAVDGDLLDEDEGAPLTGDGEEEEE